MLENISMIISPLFNAAGENRVRNCLLAEATHQQLSMRHYIVPCRHGRKCMYKRAAIYVKFKNAPLSGIANAVPT